MAKLNLEFKLPVSIFREGKFFIAYSPALDLSTSATDYEKARKRFVKIVNIFFEELIAKDTLGEVLESLGWQKTKKEWTPPVLVSQLEEKVKVPAKL